MNRLHPVIEECLESFPRLSLFPLREQRRNAVKTFAQLLKDKLAQARRTNLNRTVIQQIGRAINQTESILSEFNNRRDPAWRIEEFINFVQDERQSSDDTAEIQDLFNQIQTSLSEHPSATASDILFSLGRLVGIEVERHRVPEEMLLPAPVYPVDVIPPQLPVLSPQPVSPKISQSASQSSMVPVNGVIETLNSFDWQLPVENKAMAAVAEVSNHLSRRGIQLNSIGLENTPLAMEQSRKAFKAISTRTVSADLIRAALEDAFDFVEKERWVYFSWFCEGVYHFAITLSGEDETRIAEFFTHKTAQWPILVPLTRCLSVLLKEAKLSDLSIAAFALYSLTSPATSIGQAVFDCVNHFAHYRWVTNPKPINDVILCVDPQNHVNFSIRGWGCRVTTGFDCRVLDNTFERVFSILSSVPETQQALYN